MTASPSRSRRAGSSAVRLTVRTGSSMSSAARSDRGGTVLVTLSLMAVAVGIAAGIGAVLFRALIAFVHNLAFLGELSLTYDANVHTPPGPFGPLMILVPAIGALVVAFLVSRFAPEAKGHGVPEVMDAVYYGRGRIRARVASVKALASSISIGTGGSVGREGPIAQIGSAFGATLGNIMNLQEWQRGTLIACGAGGGIAATFNTPIGGLLFAVELMMPEISYRTLIPVALATGTATAIGRVAFGDYPAFTIPELSLSAQTVIDPGTILGFALLGILFGVVSMVYIRSIYGAEDLFARLPGSYYTRHALGMLVVGVVMVAFMASTGHYYVQGVGYATVQDVMDGSLTAPLFLLVLFAGKLLAVSLTLGSGASGGVFSPALFLGATLGSGFAIFATGLVPALNLDPVGAGVVGMAAMVGGATGAVVTAIVMIFEMTRDYNVILPLLITVTIAYAVRKMLLSRNVYDLKLARRGHYIPEALHANMHLLDPVRYLLHTPLAIVDESRDGERIRRFVARTGRLPDAAIVEGGSIVRVVRAEELDGVDLTAPLGDVLDDLGTTRFVVVDQDVPLFDVLAAMRRVAATTALVTRDAKGGQPKAAKGIITADDITQASNLPQPLVGVQDRVETGFVQPRS
jgi:CIC family chloride channel protein